VITPAPATPKLPQPVGELSTASVDELVRLAGSLLPGGRNLQGARRRSVRTFAEHLAGFSGATWQDRWVVSGWEELHRPIRVLNPPNGAGWSVTLGFKWLAAMRVIVPSSRAVRLNAVPDYGPLFQALQCDPLLDEVAARIAGAEASRRYRQIAHTELTFALTSQAIPMAQLTPAALLHFIWQHREAGSRDRFGGLLLWKVLAEMGHFPQGTPPTLRLATNGDRRDVTQLVDYYDVADPQIRQLFIDYINHRSAEGMDYSTTVALTRHLVSNFWLTIQQINPGQADLNLSEDTYRSWRQIIDTVESPDGPRPRTDIWTILIQVRGFYLDLQSWSAEEPQRWARWVARCPIPQITGNAYSRARRRQTERMADRTRERQPLLPLLVEHVTTGWERTRTLLDLTLATTPGNSFEHAGVRYQRRAVPEAVQQQRRSRGLPPHLPEVVEEATGTVVRVRQAADNAFWRWAIVEVLRLTGIRQEELLELTHLSIRQFQRPNGEVVALLVIAPSKSDRERVIPMSAELFRVIAQLVRHHTRDGRPVPLVHRWDPAERRYSPALPFLFQHQKGPLRATFSSTWLLKMLRVACTEIAQTHPEFADVRFTPHDFRRIFATDLVNNGLPIHIGAALLGHTNLQTTRGYVAVFDDDVVRHYQHFLDQRRQRRPSEEYRPATPEEWTEFEQHFDKRKVELGGCARPYGTPCTHEHACIRCPMLQVNPAMLPRLDELETDLIARRHRAEAEAWLGEIDGINLTLQFLRQKRDQTRRAQRSTLLDLGMPDAKAQKPRSEAAI
jgi:integrase